MRSNYEEKRANRQERYERLAAKFKNESTSRYERFQSIASFIPMGQPILVGHHSEKRHRRDIEKMDNNMRASWEAGKKSAYYAGKAETVENNNAISSDDVNAVAKLTEKIAALEKNQELMKGCNKIIRGKGTTEEKIAKIVREQGLKESTAAKLFEKDCFGGLGFAQFNLTNNNANIRTAKQRLARLQKMEAAEDKEIICGDIKILHNASENRVQIFFPGKPSDEVRKQLKGYGFRWSPTSMAWQAFYSNRAKWAAETVVNGISKNEEQI